MDVGVDRGELLQRLHLPEPQHRPLSSSERQVAVLDPVVGPATHLLPITAAQLIHGRAVAAQAVGGDLIWRTMTLQRLPHEGQRCRLVTGFGNETFQHLAFMIDRPPQVDHLAIQLHVHLVQMPPPLAKAAHSAHPLLADIAGEEWAESVPPEAYRLVADVDPPLEQQIFYVPQRQREAHVHQHHQPDHLR